MIPRYGEPRRENVRYRLRPGSYAILRVANRVLLTHQQQPVSEFQLPGGGIDPGESPLAALHREVLEETGWHISTPRKLGAFRRFTFMPEYDLWAEKLCHVFLARPVREISSPTEPGHTSFWVSGAQAVSLVGNDGDRAFLAQVFA